MQNTKSPASVMISSYIPFPNIGWWAYAAQCSTVLLDKEEHFQKMSYRNRYCISGANGAIQLSIPLVNGRNQRTLMKEVHIWNSEKWQVRHWRTLVSVYSRSPYFDHYRHSLQPLFEKEYCLLADFCADTIAWLKQQTGIGTITQATDAYVGAYDAAIADMRYLKPADVKNNEKPFPEYYQVFKDRIGFEKNLSLLDLLFSEGPYAKKWIEANIDALTAFL